LSLALDFKHSNLLQKLFSSTLGLEQAGFLQATKSLKRSGNLIGRGKSGKKSKLDR